MNETQVKLMQEYGVLVLPEDIDHDAYVLVVEALHLADDCGHEEIVLYCAGMGGELNSALAIADLIRHRGNVVGLLPGQADSCHADVWLACRERYVYPLGHMGLHESSYSLSRDTKVDNRYAANLVHEMGQYNYRSAKLLADASVDLAYDVDWWLAKMAKIGASGVRHMTALELKMYGIAKGIEEYPHPLTSPLRKEGEQSDDDYPFKNGDHVIVQGDWRGIVASVIREEHMGGAPGRWKIYVGDYPYNPLQPLVGVEWFSPDELELVTDDGDVDVTEMVVSLSHLSDADRERIQRGGVAVYWSNRGKVYPLDTSTQYEVDATVDDDKVLRQGRDNPYLPDSFFRALDEKVDNAGVTDGDVVKYGDEGFIMGNARVDDDDLWHKPRSSNSQVTFCGKKITANARGLYDATCQDCRKLYQLGLAKLSEDEADLPPGFLHKDSGDERKPHIKIPRSQVYPILRDADGNEYLGDPAEDEE